MHRAPQKETSAIFVPWIRRSNFRRPATAININNRRMYTAIGRSWVILPKISGTLSCIGSALVGRHIAKKGLKEVSLTSHMLFRISIVDFICSFFVYFLSSWMAPRGTLAYAAGNQATCDVQGFVFVFELIYFATAYTELAAICECHQKMLSCYSLTCR